MKREEAEARLNTIIENSCTVGGWKYRAKVNEWENYGKSRTYFSIVKTRDCSKHYSEKRYGFIDNITGEYVPEKYGDLRKNFDFGGTGF